VQDENIGINKDYSDPHPIGRQSKRKKNEEREEGRMIEQRT
jgi:hypothetical protein